MGSVLGLRPFGVRELSKLQQGEQSPIAVMAELFHGSDKTLQTSIWIDMR